MIIYLRLVPIYISDCEVKSFCVWEPGMLSVIGNKVNRKMYYSILVLLCTVYYEK